MKLMPARLLLSLCVLSAAPAFAQVAATVNGKQIPSSKVEQGVKQLLAQGKYSDTPQLRDVIKRDLITREVMIQEADRQGYGTRTEVKSALDNARQSVVINALLAAHLKSHPVEESDLRAEYAKVKAGWPEKDYRARHILVESEDEAKSILAKIKAGSKFEDMAKQYSKDASAANGGDLDWASPNRYVPEFSRALMAMQKGALSDAPIKSRFGYHIVRLDDTRAAKIPAYEDVRQELGEGLQQRKLQAYKEELMKKAKIQ
ncbi:peptidylprolyl isomerase [Massilia sp. CF038]|uniref:peptidylprolyl isomerase n=1 Tax=Massilia sp. CF038 TaxID=1881045 RepID=UPI00090F3FDF|nr:peptidylprolyl isomerase [Massilia sp. CF038]SHG77659.1 peptidyl-prolyl cis-trans isomerase C [Massilia sp. CF038]